MQQEAIRKINKMGEAGSVIILVLKIILIIGIIGTLIGIIALGIFPKNLVTISLDGNATAQIDLSAFGESVFDDAEGLEYVPDIVVDIKGSRFTVNDVDTDGEKTTIKASGQIATFGIRSFIGILLIVMIRLIFMLVTLFMAGFLAKSFRYCQSPFEDSVIKRMQYFAISLIPWAFTSIISSGIISYFLTGSFSMTNVTLNISVVFIILTIFALVYIFKYGAQLQKESDETL